MIKNEDQLKIEEKIKFKIDEQNPEKIEEKDDG